MGTNHQDDDKHYDGNCEVCRAIQTDELSSAQNTAKANTGSSNAHHITSLVRNENDLLTSLKKKQDSIADKITAFAGSMRFVYIHSFWFAVWILINAGILGAALKFDGYPFGLLTLIVSLEAIFLSTFVMLSQNRQGARADIRAELDYETNIRSEVWSLHIGQKLGVDAHHVEQAVTKLIKEARQSNKQSQPNDETT